jgi:histidinol-phosphate aminotransferase
MTINDLAQPHVMSQPVYEPGKPIEYVARELGLDPATIIKVASNENPLGSSPKALKAVRAVLKDSQLYPDGGCVRVREKLAAKLGLTSAQIAVGNGSNELLELLGHAFLGAGDEVVMGKPAFIVYKLVTLLFGAKAIEVPLADHKHDLKAMAAAITPRTKLVFLACPNNPTGTVNSETEILEFVRGLPEHVVFVLDEAYAEYVENPPDLRALIAEGRKVICLRTFSKIYGLAGFRIGYGYAPTELIALLNRVRQPFNVNSAAQEAAIAALDDEAFVRRSRRVNAAGLKLLTRSFKKLGFEVVPSAANFVLVKVGDGDAVFQRLQRAGVIVRPVRGYGLPEWIRVTVGTKAQNERLLALMAG